MAALPFPCERSFALLCEYTVCVNIPTVLLMFPNNLLVLSLISIFFKLVKISGSSQLGLGDHVFFSLNFGEIVPKFTFNSKPILGVAKRFIKKELALTNFSNRLCHFIIINVTEGGVRVK